MRVLTALLVAMLMVSCTQIRTEREEIEFADEQMIYGGLEDPTTRSGMQARYDEALRRFEADRSGYSAADKDYIISHAHFGLAVTRLWDLLEQLEEILETGGYFEAAFPESGVSSTDVNCEILEQIGDVELVVQTLLETAIGPIVDSLQVVVAYPGFSIDILNAFYNIDAFGSSAGVDLAGEFGQAEAYLLLGAMQLVSGAANYVFAYEGLVDALAAFSLVNFTSVDNNPAKYFNSNPCLDYGHGNPLLDPEFALLRQSGASQLRLSREQMLAGLQSLGAALNAAKDIDADQTNDILNIDPSNSCSDYQYGCAWGTNLVNRDGNSRFDLNRPQLDANLAAVSALFESQSAEIDLNGVIDIVAQLAVSLQDGTAISLEELLVSFAADADDPARDEFALFAGQVIPTVENLDLPYLKLIALFENPAADLKQLAPLFYQQDELFDNLDEELPGEPIERSLSQDLLQDPNRVLANSYDDYADPALDVNCDGRWNQRGDIIVHLEVEPFKDEVSANRIAEPEERSTPIGASKDTEKYPGAIGVIGAFLDVNADARPDRAGEDAYSSVHGTMGCVKGYEYDVQWPGMVGDTLLDAVVNGITDITGDNPYGAPISDGNPPEQEVRNHNILVHYTDAKDLTGIWLGHYWPSRDPNELSYVGVTRVDPANGVVDDSYLFFPDPTFAGVLLAKADDGMLSGSQWTNSRLNRMLSDLGSLLDSLD